MDMIRKQNFDKDWFFSLEDRDDVISLQYDFSAWRKLSVPHDWSTEFPYDKDAQNGRRGAYTRTGVGYYKKILMVTEDMLKQDISIEFDGAYMNSSVYINGELLGTRPYGYISFAYDLTDYLTLGLNIISVKVDCSKQESSRWYNGCGIYRHVYLIRTDKLHINRNGTYIRTSEIQKNEASLAIEVEVVNTNKESKHAIIVNTVFNSKGELVGGSSDEIEIEPGLKTVESKLKISKINVWSLNAPHLYKCVSEVVSNGHCVDQYETKFGIRKLEFKANKGFYLNDERLKFKGVCMHHDSGVVGAAVPDKILKKKLQLLKDMGCNAVRTAHNPFASVFYDLCDEIGLMVMDEIFDGWETKKASYDYGLYFDDWHQKDLKEFIKRDRNHPSVVLWSLGNEVTGMSVETSLKLISMIKELDTSRLVTCGVNGVSDNSEKNRAVLDIAGYNDGGGACFLYDRDHETRPQQLMIATEAPHTSQTRGFYRTQTWWRDKNQPRIEIENLCEEELFFDGDLAYRSSYDNAGVRVCIRDSWTLSEERDYLLGEFRWSGFDYYGESFGWPARWSDSGIIGMENCPKDSYYLYQSMWSKEPMVHILPHWTHPKMKLGTKIPVWVYTNCEQAELFLNNKSLGKKNVGDLKNLQWDVAYEPGKLEVVAYNQGIKVADKHYITASTPSRLKISSDSNFLKLDGVDTAQIDVLITDKDGVSVPYGDNLLYFKAGNGIEILGSENGNCVDTTPLNSHNRKAFNSLCMAVIRGKDLEDFQNRNEKMDDHLLSSLDEDFKRIYVASILGDTLFEDETLISIDMCSLSFKDHVLESKEGLFTCNYRLNQGPWFDYRDHESIIIDETTHIEGRIYKNGECFYLMESIFIKGKAEKVIDLTHGNKQLNLDKPGGPFAIEMQGIWNGFNSNYDFRDDGSLVRILNESSEQEIGHWWYDFPIDPFESGDYAGQGEIWFLSGEKCSFELISQEAVEMVMDNEQKAIGTAYNFPKSITFRKKV